MKFESKHLVKWGISGWVFIFWILYQLLFLKGINPLDTELADVKTGLTLLLSLTALGVPVGFLLHQVYFGSVWVWNKKRKFADDVADALGHKFPKQVGWGDDKNEDYFQIEYVWHAMLINRDAETRAYLEGRYRHLLSTIHTMGSLFASSLISLLVSGLIAFSLHSHDSMYLYYFVGLAFQIVIFISAMMNYVYYSNNLKAFQIKMLKNIFIRAFAQHRLMRVGVFLLYIYEESHLEKTIYTCSQFRHIYCFPIVKVVNTISV